MKACTLLQECTSWAELRDRDGRCTGWRGETCNTHINTQKRCINTCKHTRQVIMSEYNSSFNTLSCWCSQTTSSNISNPHHPLLASIHCGYIFLDTSVNNSCSSLFFYFFLKMVKLSHRQVNHELSHRATVRNALFLSSDMKAFSCVLPQPP